MNCWLNFERVNLQEISKIIDKLQEHVIFVNHQKKLTFYLHCPFSEMLIL